jgi:hypothetical protein
VQLAAFSIRQHLSVGHSFLQRRPEQAVSQVLAACRDSGKLPKLQRLIPCFICTFQTQAAVQPSLKLVCMRSAQKIVLKGNNIKIPSRTQLKELDKNFEFTSLILFSLFHFSLIILPFIPFISTENSYIYLVDG